MVDAQPAPQTASASASQGRKQSSPNTLVWSHHDEIHKLAVQPVKALINLVGSKDTTHDTLRTLIEQGVAEIITKQSNVPASYAAPQVRIQSYDLPSPCPRAAKRQRPASAPASENGYLKRNFFSSLTYNKPAVTIFVFDWRDYAKYAPKGEVFDWKNHETLVLQAIHQHNQTWLADLSVPSKYMIIILFPIAQVGREQGYNIDQCMTSFKKAVQMSGDENIKSSNYFLSTGFESLKTVLFKKFVKNVHELVVSYYRDKKNNIKRKQKKLIQGMLPHIRYGTHSALYSLITSNDYAKSVEKLDAAYQQLKQTQIGSMQRFNDEKRDNADVLAMTILGLFLQWNQIVRLVDFFRGHFRIFQKDMSQLKAEQRLEEMKWRSCWFNTMGKLLEQYYKQQGGLNMSQRQWHTQASLDYFPGYYFLNCMLQLIARQQELAKLRLECLSNGRQLQDPAVLETVVKSSSSFLGKEFEVVDKQSATGKTLRSGDRFDDGILQYKLYEESMVQLGIHVLTAGQIAIGYYKQRSQLMRGPTGSLYTRTVHLINYHLSEMLDRHLRDDDEVEIGGTEVKPLVNVQEKQKLRRQIYAHLVKEKWTKEAVNLIETSKFHSASLEEYFQNEMKILMNAHNLQNHKRHSRFADLIDKVLLTEPVVEPVKLTGIVQGTSLLWARARFEHGRIQINKFNKLTLEVFSRLSQPIKVSKLSIMMSQVDLSQDIDFSRDDSLSEHYFVLSKTNPIRLERQFYLNQEDDQIGQIMLNQILLEVAPKKQPGFIESEDMAHSTKGHNKLLFSISPYLAPQESLLDIAPSAVAQAASKHRQVKRLPPPIMYSIDPMPHKIQIEAVLSDSKDQALLGDPYDVKLKFQVLENVKLKSLKAILLNFSASSLSTGEVNDPQRQRQNSSASSEGMIDVDLSQVTLQSATTMNQTTSDKFSRLSASMFSPNMSQFYQNAKGILGNSMYISPNADPNILAQSAKDSALFLGADPSIGVAVLKRSLTDAARVKVAVSAGGDLLAQVKEAEADETDFSSVELFYTKGSGQQSDSQSQDSLINIRMEGDESGATERVVELLSSEAENTIEDLNLKMVFYQEGKLNNLAIRFQYQFTQNQGLESEALHTKAFDYNVKVRAQSPFQVEWEVKSSDCFLSSLQHFFSLHLGAQEQLRKLIKQMNQQSTSIFDSQTSLPIKEEISALTGSMVASEEQTCWLVCKLTSQAQHRDITIKNLRLQLNPDVADFVTIVDSVGCEGSDAELCPGEESLCIEPAETYEVLLKLNVDKVKIARSFIQDNDGGMDVDSLGLSSLPSTKASAVGQESKDNEVTIADQVNLLKKLYTLQQIDLFSELHFEWSSFQVEDSVGDLIDLAGVSGADEQRQTGDFIPCCVGSPPMHFVSRPIAVKIKNLREVETVKLYEPFTVEYELVNLTPKVILALGELQIYGEGPSKVPFLIAGEIKSRLNLMPTDEGYILRYTFYPQVLGSHALPRLSVCDYSMQTVHLIKDFTVKVYVTSA